MGGNFCTGDRWDHRGASAGRKSTCSDAFQIPARFRHGFENESVQAIISLPAGTCEPFVNQEGQIVFVRDIHGVREGVIRLNTPVHLAPVKNITGGFSPRLAVQRTNAFGLNGAWPLWFHVWFFLLQFISVLVY